MVVKKKRRSFTYQENDAAQTQRRASGGGNFDAMLSVPLTYSPKEGRNRIRILPRTWNDDEGPRHWSFTGYIHYDVGPDKERYFCRQKMNIGDGRCPMCEERLQVLAEDGPNANEDAWQLRPAPTEICYVLNRKDIARGPQPMFMPSKKLAKNVCDISIDEMTGGVIKIDHPIRGHDVMFTVEGKGKQRDYGGIKLAPTPTPLSEDVEEMDAWMDQIVDNPIPSLFVDYGFDYINKKFGGAVASGKVKKTKTRAQMSEDDEDNETPPRKRVKKAKKTVKRRRPTPADIDDPDASLDGPEPVRRKKKVKKASKKSSLRGKISKGTKAAKSKYDFDDSEIPF